MKQRRQDRASDQDEFEIRVHFHGQRRSRSIAGFAADRLRRTLARFRSRIRQAAVRFRDINGSRGGVDQQCSIVLHLRSGPPMYFDEVDVSPQAALSRLARRIRHSITRRSPRASRRTARLQRVPRLLQPLAGGS